MEKKKTEKNGVWESVEYTESSPAKRSTHCRTLQTKEKKKGIEQRKKGERSRSDRLAFKKKGNELQRSLHSFPLKLSLEKEYQPSLLEQNNYQVSAHKHLKKREAHIRNERQEKEKKKMTPLSHHVGQGKGCGPCEKNLVRHRCEYAHFLRLFKVLFFFLTLLPLWLNSAGTRQKEADACPNKTIHSSILPSEENTQRNKETQTRGDTRSGRKRTAKKK